MNSRIAILTGLAAAAFLLPAHVFADTEATNNPYASLLATNGISPDARGVTEYLERIRPSVKTTEKVARLIRQLGAKSYRARETAEKTLYTMGLVAEHAVKEASLLDDPEVSTRAQRVLKQFSAGDDMAVLNAAIRTVFLVKPREAVSLLLDVVPLCASRHLQIAVEEALLATVSKGDKKRILEALKNDSPLVRSAAIAPLSKLTGSDKLKQIYQYLLDPHPAVRLATTRALANHGDRTCFPTLLSLLNSNSIEIRSQAATILRQLTGQYFGYAAYADQPDRAKAAAAWRAFLDDKGKTVDLKFPLRRQGLSWLNGNTLLANGYRNNVVELDPAGTTIWSYEARGAWSAEKLANGNVLVAAYSANEVQEVDRKGNVVWRYNVNCLNAKPLPNGNILVADYSGKRAIEIDRRNKTEVWEYGAPGNCCDVQRLDNGNTLVAMQQKVVEVTPTGKTVWEWSGGNQIYSAQRLPNSNTLVSSMSDNKIFEIAPDGKVVWEFEEQQPCDAYRLPNGNTLITTSKKFLEVTPDKKVLWSKEGCQYGTARK